MAKEFLQGYLNRKSNVWMIIPDSGLSGSFSKIYQLRDLTLQTILKSLTFYTFPHTFDLYLFHFVIMSQSTDSESPVKRPLTRDSVLAAYTLIKPYVYRTPVLTNKTLDHICFTPRAPNKLAPKINLHLKCENFQKVGACK